MGGTRMRHQLKILLINQYIGAIAVGYLVARGIEAFIGAFMPTFNMVLTEFLSGASVARDYRTTVRGSMISNLVLTASYLLIAYIFALWLYVKPIEETKSETKTESI